MTRTTTQKVDMRDILDAHERPTVKMKALELSEILSVEAAVAGRKGARS